MSIFKIDFSVRGETTELGLEDSQVLHVNPV